jgi:myo-inositol-1(or 4)-monophosphatase
MQLASSAILAVLLAPVTANFEGILATATRAGRQAATVISAKVGADVMKTKASRGDLLTAVDPEVQALIEEFVNEAHPDHAFLGEESVASGAKASANAIEAAMSATGAEYLWIVDPIDGSECLPAPSLALLDHQVSRRCPPVRLSAGSD